MTPSRPKSTEKVVMSMPSKEATVEEIMEKVSKIREELGFKRRAKSQQKITTQEQRKKPVTVVECQRRVAMPDQFRNQTTQNKTRENIFRSTSMTQNHFRQQSAGSKIVENPKSATDRTVNFLIKEIDRNGSNKEKVEVACKVYRDIKG